MSRFDCIEFDEFSQNIRDHLNIVFDGLEKCIDVGLLPGRAKSLALTKIEEAHMWCGKAIRDDQLARDAADAENFAGSDDK